jgi:hypothetical protein
MVFLQVVTEAAVSCKQTMALPAGSGCQLLQYEGNQMQPAHTSSYRIAGTHITDTMQQMLFSHLEWDPATAHTPF